MVIRMAERERTRSAGAAAVPDGLPFARRLRRLRDAAGLSQHSLGYAAEIDPAYVNRLERQGIPRKPPEGHPAFVGTQTPAGPAMRPSRDVIRRLWAAVSSDEAELDALLAEAGLLPESVVAAGGWEPYVRLWEGSVLVLEEKLDLQRAEVRRLAREVVELRRAGAAPRQARGKLC